MGEPFHPEDSGSAEALAQACEKSLLTQWASEDLQPDKGPWLCYISLTNLCNSRCAVCGHHKAMRLDRGLMTMEVFRRIVDELPGTVSKAYLMKQGEPFLNPRLEDMVAYLRETRPEIRIAIHTNGILARPGRLEKILPLVDYLGFSVSAVSPRVYKKVHGTAAYGAVMKNLEGMCTLLKGLEPGRRPARVHRLRAPARQC